MVSHKDAANAHILAQELTDAANVARERSERSPTSVFRWAYAAAKHREAQAAVTSAIAMARWAGWGHRVTIEIKPRGNAVS
jgi:hypothetical protein